MLEVGLTGGIGSGKSEVARRLATLGAFVIDADALAREALATGSPLVDEVVRHFGPTVRATDGGIERAALAELVFADPSARRWLEGLVHPEVRRRAGALRASVPDTCPVVVHDLPLLVETGATGFDVVVVVEAPEPVRLQRLCARGMSVQDARARMASQAGPAERRRVADRVVDNGGDLADLDRAVADLWAWLLDRAGAAEAGRGTGLST